MRRTVGMLNFMCNYGFDTILIGSDGSLIEEELRKNGFKGGIITTQRNFIPTLLKSSNKKDNYWIGLANIKTPLADSVLSYFGVT